MRTIAVMSRKGGSGKTTAVAHLAVEAARAGETVLVVDTDPQGSLTAWWRSRDADDLRLVEHGVAGVADVVGAAREAGVTALFIDTRPGIEADATEAATASDLVVVPVQPSILDLRAAADTLAIATEAGTRAVVLLNRCPPPRGSTEAPLVSEARSVLAAADATAARTAWRNRQAFSVAMIDGRTAGEVEPRSKAAAEVTAFRQEMQEMQEMQEIKT